MVTWNAGTKYMGHLDEAILEDIWRALWNEETIRNMDINDISVDVENGQVCLSGHVSMDKNNQRIQEIAWSFPGVIAVHHHLVTDQDLPIQVAQALGDDERTRPFTLPVYSYHGWVGMGGLVPDRDIQRAAEETAASVPAVRGVILLPDIEGEKSAAVRNAVQPQIGLQVYGKDAVEGTVYQVVINPRNRLVTHAIARVRQTSDGWQASCDYLVPVEALDVADAGGIFLSHSAPAINQFPVFNRADYPFAPLTWQPPFPYAVGSVRWHRQEQCREH